MVISKKDALTFITDRDRAVVERWLAQLEEAVKARYKGQNVSVPVSDDIPAHIRATLEVELTALGWTMKYSPPGWDQRDGKWPGSLVIS